MSPLQSKNYLQVDGIRANSCNFAIYGGRHTPFAGSADIDDGITLDLGAMNQVRVSLDRSVLSVGAGARWTDVYSKLERTGLAVAGGRSNLVGVAGLTTGGGISFFSPRKGLVCDNVRNYELVLANGSIFNVNAREHADLMVALRGGSNNLGVVTRFDLETFQQDQLWGGDIIYNVSTTPEQLDTFVNFGANKAYDEFTAFYQVFAFREGQYVVLNTPIYTKPVANPAVFQPFTKIHSQLANTLRVAELSSFTNFNASAVATGLRNAFITTTFKNDLTFLTLAIEMWTKSAATIAALPKLKYTMLNQHLVPAVTSKSAAFGGNSLGPDAAEGPLIVCLLSLTWQSASDDAAVMEAATALIDEIEIAAKAKGVYSSFKYLNYAAGSQDVINGYGVANKARLQAVSKAYDPKGLFQRAVPGGFKLFKPIGARR